MVHLQSALQSDLDHGIVANNKSGDVIATLGNVSLKEDVEISMMVFAITCILSRSWEMHFMYLMSCLLGFMVNMVIISVWRFMFSKFKVNSC